MLASDTVTDLLDFFSFIFGSKILGLCYRKMKSYLDSQHEKITFHYAFHCLLKETLA